jgi:IS5 family transposase
LRDLTATPRRRGGHWFNLSDPAVEEALYDSQEMRQFVGIDLGREPVPDEATVCRFRHLLEEHDYQHVVSRLPEVSVVRLAHPV